MTVGVFIHHCETFRARAYVEDLTGFQFAPYVSDHLGLRLDITLSAYELLSGRA